MGALVELFRPRLALLNGVSALVGGLLYPGAVAASELVAAGLGVTLLAAGASAFNQAMEVDLDRRMARTRQRPIPRGIFSPGQVVRYGGGAIGAGGALLGYYCGTIPLLLGLFALLWYLGVYTPLKPHTSLSLLLGALCGAMPPAVGWCAAGGGASDYRLIILGGIFFLWQVPHFWLLQGRHGEEYRAAGIPLVGRHPGLFWLWLLALLAAAMLLPAFGLIEARLLVWYALFPAPLLLLAALRAERSLFHYLNLFPLLLGLLLALGRA